MYILNKERVILKENLGTMSVSLHPNVSALHLYTGKRCVSIDDFFATIFQASRKKRQRMKILTNAMFNTNTTDFI
jgi:hypothetical protein